MPHFVSPKFLSFIVSVHDAEQRDDKQKSEKNDNKSATSNGVNQKKPYQKPQSRANSKTEVIQNSVQISKEPNGIKATNPSKSPESSEPKYIPKGKLTILNSELKEVQSFGSVDLIPVTNASRPELKVHEKPVKNLIEITPLLNNQNEKTPIQAEKFNDLSPPKDSSKIQG